MSRDSYDLGKVTLNSSGTLHFGCSAQCFSRFSSSPVTKDNVNWLKEAINGEYPMVSFVQTNQAGHRAWHDKLIELGFHEIHRWNNPVHHWNCYLYVFHPPHEKFTPLGA